MKSSPARIAQIEEAIARFIDQIANKHSAKAYRFDLLQLSAFLLASDTSFEGLTPQQAARYVESLSAGGLSIHAIRRRVSAARSFYRYLLGEGIISSNPFTDVKAPSIHPQKESPPVLLPVELQRCLSVLSSEVNAAHSTLEEDPFSRGLRRRHFYAVRRRAIVVVLASTGLRLSELLNLEQMDIEQRGPGFQIRIDGQGANDRRIPLTRTCLPALVDWLKVRKRIPTPNAHLFIGYDGRPCSRMSIRQIMKWLHKRVPTHHSLNARLFRRSFNTPLETHRDLWVSQGQLGNGDISKPDTPNALTENQPDLPV